MSIIQFNSSITLYPLEKMRFFLVLGIVMISMHEKQTIDGKRQDLTKLSIQNKV